MDGEDIIITLIIAALAIVLGRKMTEGYEVAPPPPVTLAPPSTAPAMTTPPPVTPLMPAPPVRKPAPVVTSSEIGKVFDNQNLSKLPESELERRKFMQKVASLRT
jgi:hypothetical protein